MLPVVEPDGRSTARQMLLACLALIPASLLPVAVGMDGRLYAAGAAALGLWFLHSNIRVATATHRAEARAVLIASVIYLPLLYGLLAFDRRW
jgi:protoheme IX farnesyltransferase